MSLIPGQDRYRPKEDEMWSILRLLPSGSSTLEQIMQIGSAAVIVFKSTFYVMDLQCSMVGQQSVYSVCVALQQYMASPSAGAVREALSSAVRTYEAGFSRWIPGSAKRSKKKAELIDTITEIVVQHHLHM
ncbi:uncharacterized protein F5891DRAFT_1196325 [Suillus fuscotomentosus]|uniref:Uncharacterized protein n=1 Tax=Suillus fuscotomentosus TaxID=1912939 RepID=A0AAD4DTD7_9AGAM|nr:uncharacterized protein F5891DRAFT_1196325 [Suillus fuscotomentosus]KAG1893477.1 hypothetical protein F5891DRAFT_1196325 [Suillus fuscotomentosus]